MNDEQPTTETNKEPMSPWTFIPASMRRPKLPIPQQLLLLAGILLLLLGSAATPKVLALLADAPAAVGAGKELPLGEPEREAISLQPLSDIAIEAQAAYVWDVNEQKALYSKNADDVLPLASITKLMTALVAFEILDTTATISIPLAAVRQEGASGLSDGETFTLESLTELTLLSSSNDGAWAIAAAAGASLVEEQSASPAAFVAAMNIRARELGLSSTEFLNPTGLDVSKQKSGAYSTARETTLLMEYLIRNHPELVAATQKPYSQLFNDAGAYHNAENTNVIVDSIPNLIGSKTGYTDLAGGNLVVAFDAGLNHPIIITVLGSSRTNRFTDVQTLVEAVRQQAAVSSE